MAPTPKGALLVVVRGDGIPVYEAKWRLGATQRKRRLGPAWVEPGDSTTAGRRRTRHDGWIARRGRPADGFLTEDDALVAMTRAIAEDLRRAAEKATPPPVLFEELAAAWLEHRRTVRAIKPSTLYDYQAHLRMPGTPARKRGTTPKTRIMTAFAGRPITAITTTDIENFLRTLDTDPGVCARTVNKHRQILHAIFAYATRPDTHALPANPVTASERRHEGDPAELVTYTPAEVMEIVAAAKRGAHRDPSRPAVSTAEQELRRVADQQDATIICLAAFAGLRMGELLALRWRDINPAAGRIHVQRSYTSDQLTSPKGRRDRTVPLADQPAAELEQLARRPRFTQPGDLVFCSATGDFIDGTALRRRYQRARDAARAQRPGMPSLRFHGLRHTFGTLAATSFDLVNVQAMMGHADQRTTARYLHARPAPDDAQRLTRLINSDEDAESAP